MLVSELAYQSDLGAGAVIAVGLLRPVNTALDCTVLGECVTALHAEMGAGAFVVAISEGKAADVIHCDVEATVVDGDVVCAVSYTHLTLPTKA